MKTFFSLRIDEMGRNNLRDSVSCFNIIKESFETLSDVKNYLIDRYGKMPGRRNKIYIDTKKGTKVVGFLHSFWNRDCSHDSKSWFQTDWICVRKNISEVILI